MVAIRSRSRGGIASPLVGKVAVVTGAGSGIGRTLAVELSRRGARVSGCDVDAVGLARTAALVAASGDAAPGDPPPVSMHTAVVDTGDPEAVVAYAARVCAGFGVVHQIYNNAGIAFRHPVQGTPFSDYERVLRVNLYGVIHGTQAFLPHLIASGDGHVVNVSSLNGYLAQPDMSHYCVSKFGVRAFTECLALEMRRDRLPVRVSVVHPGGVRTAIATNALARAREAGHAVSAEDERGARLYTEKALRMDAASAARVILDGVERGRSRILVGLDATLVDALVRVAPERVGALTLWLERLFSGGLDTRPAVAIPQERESPSANRG